MGLTCAVLDKTGTITNGAPQVVDVKLLPGATGLSIEGVRARDQEHAELHKRKSHARISQHNIITS